MLTVRVVMSFGVGVGIGVDFRMAIVLPAYCSATRYTSGCSWSIPMPTSFDPDTDSDSDPELAGVAYGDVGRS